MTNSVKVLDYDIIYLSYDEPNAEKNYSDLCKKVPWAKRVHGVKGSDNAHKACAELSETDRFVTIDGDNIVTENLLQQEVEIESHVVLEKSVISWSAYNIINGLIYGNGGIKCWPKEYALNMKTHENADPSNLQAQVEFCWDINYIQVDHCFSTIYNNATPQQAWRAGFREGVKMSLEQGKKPTIEEFKKNHWRNLHRLYIWCMIGLDIQNGDWAIYGAREGLYKTMCTDWDYINVRDFEYLNNLWKKEYENISENNLHNNIEYVGKELIKYLEIPISKVPLENDQSVFFKKVYNNPTRLGKNFY